MSKLDSPKSRVAHLTMSSSNGETRPQLPLVTSSSSGHSQPLEQGGGIFSVPEEPMAEETVEAFQGEGGGSGEFEGTNVLEGTDKRPWYKRPSPWWMLVLMPLSAMTLAGSAPAAIQIYIDLVCKSINKSATLQQLDTSIPGGLSQGSPIRFQPYDLVSPSKARLLFASLDSRKSCESNPEVQAIVSKLIAFLTTSLGILTCITAASWASLSDRIGRLPVLAIAAVGALVSYSNFVLVATYSERLPGGFWFLLFGTCIYGILGGTAAAVAATYAYVSDCIPSASRARIFSLTLGLRFTGMAIGPTVSSLLIRVTGTPVSPLILVVVVHTIYIALILLVVPESLSKERREENRRVWSASLAEARARVSETQQGSGGGWWRTTVAAFGKTVFAFLRPLSIVAPVTVTSSSGRTHRDWSLTFIAISSGLASLILASYQSMFQYGAATFGWSAVESGYWFSGIVATRAITLTLVLPVIIKIYHHTKSSKIGPQKAPSPSRVHEPTDRTPLLSSQVDSPHQQADPTTQSSNSHTRPRHTPAFDLGIAQVSLALEVVCYALVPFLLSQVPFIVFTILASCGAGFGPAIQSLGVELYTRRGGIETGRLFGVLGVVQSICSQIVGPTVYGLTYMKLVAFYPQGIFFVSVAAVSSALLALFFVELPGPKKSLGNQSDA